MSFVLKLMAKHFIDPKRIFLTFFLATTQIALFWAKIAPCPFRYESIRILDIPALWREEALKLFNDIPETQKDCRSNCSSIKVPIFFCDAYTV
jgi:hypothetical protein